MSVHESKLHVGFTRWLAASAFAAALLLGHAASARAQQPTPTPAAQGGEVDCLPMGQPLIKLPEIVRQGDGKLRGALVLIDQPTRVTFRQPYTVGTSTQRVTGPNDKAPTRCFVQYMRQFRVGTGGPVPTPSPYGDLLPGPTLRARVGDLVQLTFLNQINPTNFGDSIDRAERRRGNGCDETSSGYPGNAKEKFPDCFHGSSTGNLHFHGTHTNPNSTADNVFIEIRPSLREDDKPVVTQESVRRSFDEFFTRCEERLSRSQLREWPKVWADMPNNWTEQQEKLLKRYDSDMESKYGRGVKKLWPIDERQRAQGAWPQYYIGGYPYCFRLPEYTQTVWPPVAPTPAAHAGGHGAGTGGGNGSGMGGGQGAGTGGGQRAGQSGGAGTAELGETAMGGHGTADEPLIMGQSPGTHWYHAHKHGSTAINVANGMTGAFIIEGKEYDDALNAFYGPDWTRSDSTHILMVNQFGVTPNLMRGAASQIDKGPDFSVNGRLRPVITMKPGEVQLWRIINGSGRAGMFFTAPPAGFQWRQIAQDGVQFQDANYQASLNQDFLMSAGNRVDLLVKAPATPCVKAQGCYPVMVKNVVDMTEVDGANPLTLLSVNVDGTPASGNQAQFISPAPTPPPFLADIADSEISGTKVMRFGTKPPGSPAQHTIDGQQFDGEVGAVVLLNRVEEWKIYNDSFGPLISHPFHIHINPFQVTEVFSPNDPLIDPKTGKAPINPKTGKPYIDPQTKKQATKYTFQKASLAPGQCYLNPDDPDSWKPCGPPLLKAPFVWWDVFPIPSGYAPTTDAAGKVPLLNKQGKPVQVAGYFKMRSRFVDYSGFYVIHCHILAHEDRGMMTIVEVAPARTPYSHN